MKPFLNTFFLLLGLFVLTQVHSKTQTAPTPASCIWASTAGTSSPNMMCVDAATLIKSVLPAAVTSAITGGPCKAPATATPGIAIYAQDPGTLVCFPVITVSDQGFVATLKTPESEVERANP